MKPTSKIDSINSATSIQAMAIKKMNQNYRVVWGNEEGGLGLKERKEN
jgi:hypothetical protein